MKRLNTYIAEALVKKHIQKNDFIDLGLSSGVMWATCNLGANAPEEIGDYFTWGDTEPATDKRCDWKHYKHADGWFNKILKYNQQKGYGNVDNLTQLEDEDDAAKVLTRGKYRMPTWEEIQELLELPHEFVENYNNSNNDGFIFKGKNDIMFLPLTGRRTDTAIKEKDMYCYYWTVDTYSKEYPDCAKALVLSKNGVARNDSEWKSQGFAIRPILNK